MSKFAHKLKEKLKSLYRDKRVRVAVLVIELLVLLALCTWSIRQRFSGVEIQTPAQVANLLVNPSFEGGWTRDTVYWTAAGGPLYNPFGEIFTPEGWRSWWIEGTACATGITFDKGRPEIQVIDLDTGFPDANRVLDGRKAVKAFTFWRCHEMGLLQRVTLPKGYYTFSIYAHAWHTNCSNMPYSAPYNKDCDKRLWDSWDMMRVGIDPTGGIDPFADTVVWGSVIEQYGIYGQQIVVENVYIDGNATVFFSSECNYPLKHDDVYIDKAELVHVYPVFLPLVSNGD